MEKPKAGEAVRLDGDYMAVAPSLDPFAAAEERYRALVAERRRTRMEVRAFRRAVRDLGVLDGEGRAWVLGPADGTWYRRDADRWVPAEPPRRLVCPHCAHHNLPRHRFCVVCGRRLLVAP